MADFFTQDFSQSYDDRNSRLAPITGNLHFLIHQILKDLPQYARILCVGVGTGAEIFALSKSYPDWTFVGVDPSAPMLDVCRERLTQAGIIDRCELIHGYVEDITYNKEYFDAALSILVAHFIPRNDRHTFYKNIYQRLKVGGYFISAEISFDLHSNQFPSMLTNWARIQTLMGATPEALQALPALLHEKLSIVPPAETEVLIRTSGFDIPVAFFQSFMVKGWYAEKQVT